LQKPLLNKPGCSENTFVFLANSICKLKALNKQISPCCRNDCKNKRLQRKTGLILPLITASRFQKIELKTGLKNRIFAAK